MGKNRKPVVLLLGPSLQAVSGIATHVIQLLNSRLANLFILIHFQAGSQGLIEKRATKLIRLALSPIRLALMIVRTRPVLVHINTALYLKAFWRDIIYAAISKTLGIRIIYQIHGGTLEEVCRSSPTLELLIRHCLRLPDVIVVITQKDKKALSAFVRQENIRKIVNAVDPNEYRNCRRQKFDKEVYVLGYMGQIECDKGLFEALEAVQLLREEMGFMNFHFVMAGSGSASQSIDQQIRLRNMGNYTRIVAPLFGEAKIDFWKNVDVFLFPTRHEEKLPYTLLESMASGTPMVASNRDEIKEVVQNGIHGIIVEPNPQELANALKYMLTNKKQLQKMSAHCVKRVLKYYSLDMLARQFASLYRSTIFSSSIENIQ